MSRITDDALIATGTVCERNNSRQLPTDVDAVIKTTIVGREPIRLVSPITRMAYTGFLHLWIGFYVYCRVIRLSCAACGMKEVAGNAL